MGCSTFKTSRYSRFWDLFTLAKKPLLPVPDPKDVVLDQYLTAALIQLANADDA